MGIAEEMAKKQRAISISEFFEKNRHLLGYDNKAKALLIIVKEGETTASMPARRPGYSPRYTSASSSWQRRGSR